MKYIFVQNKNLDNINYTNYSRIIRVTWNGGTTELSLMTV